MIAFNLNAILKDIANTNMANSALVRELSIISKFMPEDGHTQSQEVLIKQCVAYLCLKNAPDLTNFVGNMNFLAELLLIKAGIPDFKPNQNIHSLPMHSTMALIKLLPSLEIAQAIAKALTGETNIARIQRLIQDNPKVSDIFKDTLFNNILQCLIL